MIVSLILPVYNVAPYISRCLKSVMDQTYIGPMECILVDDCGEDDSMEIARQLISQYQGHIAFRILSHDHNRGLSAARNTGIRAAQGDYLYFLDSDDWIEPQCIASMVSLVERYPGVELVQAGAIAHGGEAKPWLDLSKSPLPEYVQGLSEVKPIMLNRKRIPVTAWNRLVRRDFLLHNNLLFQDGLLHEDELWTFMLAKHLNSLAVMKQNVYHYEQRPSGLMSVQDVQKGQSLISIALQMIETIDEHSTHRTIDYIRRFIHLYSFNIYNESQRLSFLDVSQRLSRQNQFLFRQMIRVWLFFAKKDIRKHRLLYSLLYHTIF